MRVIKNETQERRPRNQDKHDQKSKVSHSKIYLEAIQGQSNLKMFSNNNHQRERIFDQE